MSYNIEDIPNKAQMFAQKHVLTKINHYSGVFKLMWQGIPYTQKILFFVLLIIILIIIFFLIKQQIKLTELKSSLDEPIFLTNLKQNELFNGTNTFAYKDNVTDKILNYVPGRAFGQYINGYSYSFWIYVNVYNPFKPNIATITNKDFVNQNSIIFKRGDNTPSVWLLNNYKNISFGNKIGDNQIRIDMNKWVNITYVVNGNVVNCYKNGELESSNIQILNKQTGNLYVNPNITLSNNKLSKGFPAQLAYLQYYKTPLTSEKVYEIYNYYKKYFDSLMKSLTKYHHDNTPVNPINPNKSCNFLSNLKNDAASKLSDWDKEFKNKFDKKK